MTLVSIRSPGSVSPHTVREQISPGNTTQTPPDSRPNDTAQRLNGVHRTQEQTNDARFDQTSWLDEPTHCEEMVLGRKSWIQQAHIVVLAAANFALFPVSRLETLTTGMGARLGRAELRQKTIRS